MSVWWALCRREWLEHRGGYGWAPLVVLALMLCAALTAISFGAWSGSEEQADFSEMLEHAAAHPQATDLGLRLALRELAQPFVWVYFGVAFFVMLGTLFDERKDRTVLFWKSLPPSDAQSVLSKLITTIWIAPLATIAVIFAAKLLFLILLSFYIAGSDTLSVSGFWAAANLPLALAEWLFGFFTQSLWSLPIWCWLLLVSAVAPRLPVLWALLTPLVPIVMEWALFKSTVLLSGINAHLTFIALPSYRELDSGAAIQTVGFSDMLSIWTRGGFWVGIGIALIMLAAAIYFRRRNNEL
ncbi:MAG: hypothetical protein AB8B93_07895 [Pseudomonadales bacterium]